MARILKLSVKTRSIDTELKSFDAFLLQEINKIAFKIIREILIDIFFKSKQIDSAYYNTFANYLETMERAC
nr:hypothetical protein [uncultured bacterium]